MPQCALMTIKAISIGESNICGGQRLSKRLDDHDDAIAVILVAIRELMNPPASKRRGIGFTAKL
jgi:hypothetical protein